MLYILNRQGKIVTTLDNKGKQTGYKDDYLTEYLENGSSTYTFTTYANSESSKYLNTQNMVLRKDLDGNFLLFTIESVKESHSESNEIVVNTMGASIQLNNSIVTSFKAETAYPIKTYFDYFLIGTNWEIGINEIPEKAQKLQWDGSSTILARLLSIANSFEVELRFRVEMKGNLLNKLIVDILRVRGNKTFKTFRYGNDISVISRETNITELKTAMRGVGSAVDDVITTFKDIEYDDGEFRTEKGSDLLFAYKRNEYYGLPSGFKLGTGYIIGEFSYDTESNSELFNRTFSSLKKYSEPMVNYEIEINYLKSKLKYEQEIGVGDTINVVDDMFNPPLYLEARILEKKTSFSDKRNTKVILGNYKPTKSNTNQSLKELQDKIRNNEGVWASSPLKVVIDSTKGFTFMNSDIDTTLTARVLKDDVDITQMYDLYAFSWVKYDEYGLIDSKWTESHQNVGNRISVTAEDVNNKSTFEVVIDSNNKNISSKVDIVDLITTIASHTAPFDPKLGTQWLDLNYEPPRLMLYTFNGWLNLQEVELTDEQLNIIKESVKETIIDDVEVILNGKEDSWITSPTEPLNPIDKLVWLDTSSEPAVARKFNAATNNWVKMTPEEAAEIYMSRLDTRTLTEVIDTLSQKTTENSIVNTIIRSSDFKEVMESKANNLDLADYIPHDNIKNILNSAEKNTLDIIEGLDITKYVEMTDFEQTAKEFEFNISASGGANILKNSAGYSSTSHWVVEGDIYTIQTNDLKEIDLGVAYRLNSPQSIRMYQNVKVTPNTPYTLSFYLKNHVKSMVGIKIFEITDGQSKQIAYISTNELTSGFQKYGFTFKSESSNIRIEVAADVESNALIAGIMLNLGTLAFEWSSHPTEVFGTNVQMDLLGVKVSNTATGGYTLMSPDEFSIFGVVAGELEKIATFNGETTEVNKISVEKELTLGGISIVNFDEPNFKGWGIYKT